nr:unnamed protein product [Naegleria fowleri]
MAPRKSITPKKQGKKTKQGDGDNENASSSPRKTPERNLSTSTQEFNESTLPVPSPTESSTKKKKTSRSSAGSSSNDTQSSTISSLVNPTVVPCPTKEFECASENVTKLFSNRLYVIPDYQRPYEWQPDDITKLLDDIFEALKRKGRRYFMGNVLLKKAESAPRASIIDGQQRLISLSIILAALRSLIVKKEHSDTLYKAMIDNIEECLTSKQYETMGQVRIEIQNDVTTVKKENTFFNKNIANHGFFNSRVEESTKKYFDSYLATLEEEKVVYSQSSFQMAKNLLHTRYHLKKNLKTQVEIVSFLTYLRNNCSVMVTTILPEENEFVIFGTLNCRGRDLSPMDDLKLQFSQYFLEKDNEKATAMKKWIDMPQEMKEDLFSLIFECVYVTLADTEVTTIRTSQAQRAYDRMLQQLAEKSKMTHLEFVNSYMQPLFDAFGMLKRRGGRGARDDRDECDLSESLERKVSVIQYITENYFQKAVRESSVIMMMILLAMYKCRPKSTGMFSAYRLDHLPLGHIESLIGVWHDYLLKNALYGSQKVTFGPLLNHIKSLLNNTSIYKEENIEVLKGKQCQTVNRWKAKIERQLDLSKETTKSEATQLAKVFEVVLKVIHFYDPQSIKTQEFNFFDSDNYELEQIMPKPYGMKRGDSGSFLKIGNYSLKKKFSPLPVDVQKKLAALNKIVYPITSKNVLHISEKIVGDDKSWAKKDLEKRTTSITNFLEQLLGESLDDSSDEEE